ncbi:MAG TPA: hypothetical protein VMS56_07935 [Thermoanaerobaculia bacterium]|nr:hypothetical protein [Thermoanaerobaculia bacterium]
MSAGSISGGTFRRWGAEAVAAASLVGFGFAFHRSALEGWWLFDDPQIVAHARQFPWYEIMFLPSAWRWLSTSNFTPLVTLSFELDLMLGGLDPRVYYAHQLSSALAAGLALHAFLRALRVPVASSAMLAAAFLASPPMVECVRSLMTRHYLEGSLLFLVAANLWVRARTRAGLTAASALALLAMLAKELFVPCFLGLLLIDRFRRLPRREMAERALAVAAVVTLYTAWRFLALGGFGGYGPGLRTGSLPTPLDLISIFAGEPDAPWWALWLAALSFVVFRSRLRPRAAWSAAGAILLLGLVPILPVLRFPFPRYFYVLGLMIVVLFGLAHPLLGRRGGLLVPLALLVSSAGAGLQAARGAELEAAAWEREGRWMLEGPPAPTLFESAHTLYLDGLRHLYLGPGSEPAHPVALSTVVVQPEWPEMVRFRHGRMVKPTEHERVSPLDPSRSGLVLANRGGRYAWSLWPRGGDWRYVASPFGEAFAVEAEGSLRAPTSLWPPTREGEGWFRFARRVERGWIVSPRLPLPQRGEAVRWGTIPE